VGRYRAEGEPGLRDRSSAPHRIPHRTGEQRLAAIAALRRVRFTGPEIAELLDMPLSTVSGILTRTGYRPTIHAAACRTLGIRHLRTRAYRPQTNGKAERFIRTLLGGWAYGAIYHSSAERTAALDRWLWHYNHHRKHSALGHQPPIARLRERDQP
jgi:transposase InsO family protein